ncbi:hypothetical protein LTR95_005042, partial [Oleoguttula sp. CCFEE 5521]
MSTSINDPFVGFDDIFNIDQDFDFDTFYAPEPQRQDASASINGHPVQLGPQISDETSNLPTPTPHGPHASFGIHDHNINPQLLSTEHQAASAQDRLPTETDVDRTVITNGYTPLPTVEQTSVSAEVYAISGSETYSGHPSFTNEITNALSLGLPLLPINHQPDIISTPAMSPNMQNTQYAPTALMYGSQETSTAQPSRPSASDTEMGQFQMDTDLPDLSDPNDGDHLFSDPQVSATQMAPSEFQHRQGEPYLYGSQMQHDPLYLGTVPGGLRHQSGAFNMITRETTSAQSAFSAGPSAKRPAAAMSSYALPQSATRVKRDCTDCGK